MPAPASTDAAQHGIQRFVLSSTSKEMDTMLHVYGVEHDACKILAHRWLSAL
jgi:hypothetical protein